MLFRSIFFFDQLPGTFLLLSAFVFDFSKWTLQIYVLFLFLQSIWPVFFTIFASKVQIVFAKSISEFVDLEKRQISPRMHYLWTDNTISPQYCTTCAQIVQRLTQYCTACGHLIQSRRNIALLAYT